MNLLQSAAVHHTDTFPQTVLLLLLQLLAKSMWSELFETVLSNGRLAFVLTGSRSNIDHEQLISEIRGYQSVCDILLISDS